MRFHAAGSEPPRLFVRREVFPFDPAARRWRPESAAETVTVELIDGTWRGRGEAVPYARYGETVEEVIDTLERLQPEIERGLSRRSLQLLLPPGAARNALDLALWDIDAKRTGTSAWQIAGLDAPRRVETAFTIPFGSPEAMAAAAAEEAHRPILKLELGDEIGRDLQRVDAVRDAVPRARLILDAHEAWDLADLVTAMPALAALGVELIEQPLPAGADAGLADFVHEIPLAADESCRDRHSLEAIAGRYEAVTIKLDKAGGFTEALEILDAAAEAGLDAMLAGAFSSSLGLAPAAILAARAKWVDLDQALLLKRDRQPGLRYDGSMLYPPNVSLWG